MELVRGIHNIKTQHKGCALTIGNFDGIHLGHQTVITQLVAKSKQLGVPATVMIFEPQPREFFKAEGAPARLSRLRDKCIQLEKLGIDRLICVSFNRSFAQFDAHQFIDKLLIQQLGVKYLVVGDDFRFGSKRRGDFSTLQQAGKQFGFDVVNMDTFGTADSKRVSSTSIRMALAKDDFDLAASLLGREFSISGRVVYGRQLGRTFGIPTANILLKRFSSPLHGVFIVEVEDAAEQTLKGVANIGNRPTVSGNRMQLEVHLFDFSGDLYHKHLNVKIKKKLRAEMKFDSIELLKKQITLDVTAAKTYFGLVE